MASWFFLECGRERRERKRERHKNAHWENRTRKKNRNDRSPERRVPLSISFSLSFSCSDANAILNSHHTTHWLGPENDWHEWRSARSGPHYSAILLPDRQLGRTKRRERQVRTAFPCRDYKPSNFRVHVFCRFAFQFHSELTRDLARQKICDRRNLYICMIRIYNVTHESDDQFSNEMRISQVKDGQINAYFSAALYAVFYGNMKMLKYFWTRQDLHALWQMRLLRNVYVSTNRGNATMLARWPLPVVPN